jgi:hypothetical protein
MIFEIGLVLSAIGMELERSGVVELPLMPQATAYRKLAEK